MGTGMMMGLASATTTAALLISAPYHVQVPAAQAQVGVRGMFANDEGKPMLAATGTGWADAQLRSLQMLQPNWDGYGADPIGISRLNVLARLLKNNLPDNAPVGSIVPGADGSVQAEWHLHAASFGLLVNETGAISTWYQPSQGAEIERSGPAAMELLKAAVLSTLA
jgi:hypothetical protein